MTRIDHTNCNHPRTPKARAACRDGRAHHTSKLTAADLGISIVTPAPKAKVVKAVSELSMPKLTPAQLESAIFQSMLRKRG
jgi:hypothetical protein